MSKDRAREARVLEAMMGMSKLDITGAEESRGESVTSPRRIVRSLRSIFKSVFGEESAQLRGSD